MNLRKLPIARACQPREWTGAAPFMLGMIFGTVLALAVSLWALNQHDALHAEQIHKAAVWIQRLKVECAI